MEITATPRVASRQFVPYVAELQSPLIDQLTTRLVLLLSRVGTDQPSLRHHLCPLVGIEGESLSLMAHLAAPVIAKSLKKPVASLSHRASEVSAAMDAVHSGF